MIYCKNNNDGTSLTQRIKLYLRSQTYSNLSICKLIGVHLARSLYVAPKNKSLSFWTNKSLNFLDDRRWVNSAYLNILWVLLNGFQFPQSDMALFEKMSACKTRNHWIYLTENNKTYRMKGRVG